MKRFTAALALLAACNTNIAAADRKPKEQSALDRYIAEAMAAHPGAGAASPGSLWSPSGSLSDLASDFRAARVDDSITVLVVERASAVAQGSTKTARSSNANASVSSLAGPVKAGGALASLAGLSSTTELDGQGSTSRSTVLTTTLTARVTHVLPNGYMVVEGSKDVQVNSERQAIILRGVVRPSDLAPGNLVRSDRLAQLEVRVNGKGVVSDAVRRPMFLYRLLLGLLPF